MDPKVADPSNWRSPSKVRWGRAEKGGVAVSFSGNEANHLFLNQRGASFEDISGVSGLDSRADSRAFAVFDYDRDGWQDIVLVNSNAPMLHLFHNEIGTAGGDGRVIGVRFVGGNHAAVPADGHSNRDGYGAVVRVDLGEAFLLQANQSADSRFAPQSRQ